MRVPAGDFLMGSTPEEIQPAQELCEQVWTACNEIRFQDELPQHRVQVDAFWLDQTEVSNAQYRRCVDAGTCTNPFCWEGLQFNAPQQPVVCVIWQQAQDYCTWVGGRLPTEAEWEYAARGPESLLYPWGNEFNGSKLNYCDATCRRRRSDTTFNDGQYYSAPVGMYPGGASWCGALDMAGNVSEWVADWFGFYAAGTQSNPTGPSAGRTRLIRGGSWFFTRVEARTAWREGMNPDIWFDDIGFRCAR